MLVNDFPEFTFTPKLSKGQNELNSITIRATGLKDAVDYVYNYQILNTNDKKIVVNK